MSIKEQTPQDTQTQEPNPETVSINYGIPELEEIRKTLLNQYHTYTTAHTGLIIAIIIGTLTLLSRWDIFFDSSLSLLIFYLIISFIVGLTFYITGRLSYWTSLSNMALILTEKKFNEFHRKHSESPCICSMQICATEEIGEHHTRSPYGCLARFSITQLLITSIGLVLLTFSILTEVSLLLQVSVLINV